jgi:hypothetical protein
MSTVKRARVRTLQLDNTISMLCVPLLAVAFVPADSGSAPASPSTTVQRSVPSEKESRTPAQQKINSQLLYEIYRLRGEARQKHVPEGATGVRIDAKKRALVDVRAEVTPALQKKLGTLGATIVSTSREYHSILAWMPLLRLERLAADGSVRAIEPAAEARTAK